VCAWSDVSSRTSFSCVYLLGGLVFAFGTLVAAVGLIGMPGRPRRTGWTFVGGLSFALIAAGMVSWPLSPDGSAWFAVPQVAGALALVGAVALVAGIAGVGL